MLVLVRVRVCKSVTKMFRQIKVVNEGILCLHLFSVCVEVIYRIQLPRLCIEIIIVITMVTCESLELRFKMILLTNPSRIHSQYPSALFASTYINIRGKNNDV